MCVRAFKHCSGFCAHAYICIFKMLLSVIRIAYLFQQTSVDTPKTHSRKRAQAHLYAQIRTKKSCYNKIYICTKIKINDKGRKRINSYFAFTHVPVFTSLYQFIRFIHTSRHVKFFMEREDEWIFFIGKSWLYACI